MSKTPVHFFQKLHRGNTWFNIWDFLALFFIVAILFGLAWSAKQMALPYQVGESIPISLDPHHLPQYALRSVMRIFIALGFSFLFTFTIATWAAKSSRAEKFLIPMIDILQAVPVLSFLSISVVSFIALFRNSLLGPECASIFAIFTAQAWNMALGFYQSLRMIPEDLKEAATIYHLSAWQRFWRIEVPFSMPSLLWNTMMSLSASWFFVVASEAITVSNQEILLPGVGSYIAVAIKQADLTAVAYAIFTMLIVILIYDQVIFRPLITWSERFRSNDSLQEEGSSWVLDLLERTYLLRFLSQKIAIGFDYFVNGAWIRPKRQIAREAKQTATFRFYRYLGISILFIGSVAFLFRLSHFIVASIPLLEVMQVVVLGMITALRVLVLLVIASLIWIPIGVWVGMRPKVTQVVQPLAQFLAAFPANLLFPLVVFFIIYYHLNKEIWLTPLMILGSQWYILFNVIAGVSNLPKDLHLMTQNFGLRGVIWWRRLALPCIFPYFITGAITAAGGAWNASIVAEVVSWGNTTLEATGLGAYIARYSMLGDFPRIALGTTVMCLWVLCLNRFLWQPLYHFAEERFQLD